MHAEIPRCCSDAPQAIHGAQWHLNLVAAALSRAFRDRAGVFVFFAAASAVSAAVPVVVFVPRRAQTINRAPQPRRNPIKLSRNEKLPVREKIHRPGERTTQPSIAARIVTLLAALLYAIIASSSRRAKMHRKASDNLSGPNRPPLLPNPGKQRETERPHRPPLPTIQWRLARPDADRRRRHTRRLRNRISSRRRRNARLRKAHNSPDQIPHAKRRPGSANRSPAFHARRHRKRSPNFATPSPT